MQPSKIPFSQSFLAKKKIILNQLSVPISEYDDLSPKGSIDVDIRELIDEINQLEGCVTTSSCSGRISVFLEGKKQDDWVRPGGQVGEGKESGESSSRQYEAQVVENGRGGGKTTAGVGGKGGGGRWLFVTHNAVDISQHECAGGLQKLLGMEDQYDGQSHGGGKRFIHFKFEPMILHILTASLEQAQVILSAALQAGFRESGAVNLTSSNREAPTPMVAVRSMGLALESLIGFHADGRQVCTVSEESLRTLLEISNDRFRVNRNRIARFRELLIQLSTIDARPMGRDGGKEWEDAEMRKERKKAEGLRRKEMMKNTSDDHVVDPEDIVSLEFFP